MTNELKNIKQLAVFKQKSIRRVVHQNEWWFSVSDIVEVLTNSSDVKQYIKKLRLRVTEINKN